MWIVSITERGGAGREIVDNADFGARLVVAKNKHKKKKQKKKKKRLQKAALAIFVCAALCVCVCVCRVSAQVEWPPLVLALLLLALLPLLLGAHIEIPIRIPAWKVGRAAMFALLSLSLSLSGQLAYLLLLRNKFPSIAR